MKTAKNRQSKVTGKATGRTLATGRITADRTDLPMLDFAHGAYTVQVLHGDARQVALRVVS